jgi:hypothetical protein
VTTDRDRRPARDGSANVRILCLALLAAVLEIGWLALWPLSAALSQSAAFTSELLASHELAARLAYLSFRAARTLVVGLSDAPISEPLGSSVYQAPATTLAVLMLLLGGVYLLALILLDRGLGTPRAALWIVLSGAVAFQATLLFLPGLFSQDVFSYIAYGRLAAVYDLNPYVWPPSVIAKDAVLPWVAEVWRTYAAPYGPLWLDVQWAMARVSGGLSIGDQAIGYRLLGDVLLLGNLVLAWAMLGRVNMDRRERTTALAALAWNPLVLFEVAGNAHNDVLMVSFSLLAVLLFARSSNGVVSGASFTLGALVKYLPGVGLVWVALASSARAGSGKGRVLRPGLIVLTSVAMSVAIAGPWLELPDSLEPIIAETSGGGFVNALPDDLALEVADHLLVPAGLSQSWARDSVRPLERLLVLTAFGMYLGWETRRVWLDRNAAVVVRACARSSLIYVLVVSTSVQPWYFCTPVAVSILLGWRAPLTRVIVSYSLLALPVLNLSYYLRDSTPAWVNALYGLLPLLPALSARLLSGSGAGRHQRSAAAVWEEEHA